MTELRGAVVLVTGASGGLGSRLAAQLAERGAVVVRAGRAGGGLQGPDAYLADLREPTGPASLVAAALQAHGRLDGIVVAAGVVAFGPADAVADETLAELVDTNLLAPVRLLRDGAEALVVTISGVVAESPTAGMAAYSAAKAGLAAYVSAASREFRRRGVRVLDARPGHTGTALSEHPIAGSAPAFGAALDPDAVAARILRAVADGEKDLPSSAF
jgi:short-subunit dehydrogenase